MHKGHGLFPGAELLEGLLQRFGVVLDTPFDREVHPLQRIFSG